MGRAGALEGRGGSSVKVSTKRGTSYLFASYSREGSHLFQNFLMKINKLPKNTGRILPSRDWKSEYYRLLDLESSQVRQTSFQMLLLGWFSCSSCAVYVASEFLVMHWGALTMITKYSTTSHKLHAFNTCTLSPINWLLANLYPCYSS